MDNDNMKRNVSFYQSCSGMKPTGSDIESPVVN